MRRYVIPIASLLLLPTTAFAQEVSGSDALLAQAAPMKPAPAAPASTTEMKKFLVFFDWDKSVLTAEARRIIANAAEDYKRTGATRIVATGYTDTSGSPDYNLALSNRRAEAVKAELVRLGVASGNIVTVGKGETDLLVPTKDGVREAQNRRVSIETPVAVAAKPAPAPAPMPAAAPPPPPPPLKWAATFGGWYGYNMKETDKGNHKTSHLLGIDAGVAYYVLPNLPIKVNQQGFHTIDTSHDNGFGGRSTLGIGYEGDFAGVRPYAGIYGGGVYGKGVQDGFVVGPELGLAYDFTRNFFGYAKAAYDFQFRNNWDEGIPNGGLGVGMRF